MIQTKMEMSAVIQSLNELEKLKLLLFDEDQYYIFEHIPKPFLIDPNAAKPSEKEVENNPEMMERSQTLKEKKNIMMSKNEFWEKDNSLGEKIKNFTNALNNIKNKENLNVIDKRLLAIMNHFGDEDDEEFPEEEESEIDVDVESKNF